MCRAASPFRKIYCNDRSSREIACSVDDTSMHLNLFMLPASTLWLILMLSEPDSRLALDAKACNEASSRYVLEGSVLP